MEGKSPPPGPLPGPAHWISASFTTTLFGRQPRHLEIQPDYDWQRNAWLTSSQYTSTLVSCLPEMCTSIWIHQFRLSEHCWPTPPQSPERTLKEAEDGISRLLLAADESRQACDKSFHDFLRDTCHRLRLRGSHLVVALIFLERLRHSRQLDSSQTTTLNPKCGAQAYIFCLLLAHKISEDRAYDNKTWAHLTRYTVEDINKMERRLLGLLGHELFVGSGELNSAFDRISDRFQLLDQNMTRGRRYSRGL